MTSSRTTYRTIVRASSIIGAATALGIVAGVAKLKVAALLLGPAGVGLLGLYQNLIQTGATLAGMGLATAGTRHVAAAAHDCHRLAIARRSLFWTTLFLALIGGLLFLALSPVLARNLLGLVNHRNDVSWLALGVALTVGAGSQTALLGGLRRVGDVARIQLYSSLAAAALGISALLLFRSDGLVPFVLVAPAAAFVTGHLYAARLPPPAGESASRELLLRESRALLALGVAVMTAALINSTGQLAVRTILQRDLGTTQLGYFQAAFTLGGTYLALLLSSMSTDYFPRLAAAMEDREEATNALNHQLDVALLLSGPAIVGLMWLSPVALQLLYSSAFSTAAEILRWILLGDVLRVISWPLGFVLLAGQYRRAYVASEALCALVFAGLVAVLAPVLGLKAAGIASLITYALYLPVVAAFVVFGAKLSIAPRIGLQGTAVFCAVALLTVTQYLNSAANAAAGGLLTLVFATHSLIRLSNLINAREWLSTMLRARLSKIRGWRGV